MHFAFRTNYDVDVGMARSHMQHARPLLALILVLALSPVAAADYALGLVAYDRGDIATAHREFSALAKQGDRAAQYSLAMLYLKSNPPDYVSARPWLEQSARQGLAEAQYMLGLLSVYGAGGVTDQKQGLRWLESAGSQGNEDAQALLDKIQSARLREAESARHKSEQASRLRADLESAKASEHVLQKHLAKSKEREKVLESERATLRKARARLEQDSQRMQRELKQNADRMQRELKRDADRMRRERAALEAELIALRARVAESERVPTPAPAPAPVSAPAPASDAVAEPAGEIVVSGTISEILPDGILLTDVSRRLQGQGALIPEVFDVFVNLLATNGLTRGQDVAFVAEATTAYRYKTEGGAIGRVRAYRALGVWSGY